MITIRAGPRAAKLIREEGLAPAMVEIIPGAAGGPKGLGISGLDRAIFAEWLPSAPRVRHLVGASIGAWRFAAACCDDPRAALAAFADAYTRQSYPPRPSRRFVSQAARAMLAELFAGREAQILANPWNRLHILAVRGRWPLARDSSFATPLAFGIAAMANAVGRRHLARFIDRTVFVDEREHPPCLGTGSLTAQDAASLRFDAFHTHRVSLGKENLGDALLASASIPLVLEGVADIPRAPPGIYWDGGIIDYHLHLPYHHASGIVLYPHFTDHIVPGWLDKGMPWRKARGAWLDNVVLVAPSREYLAGLPHGKLPDRRDFARFAGDDAGRTAYWRRAIGESDRLAEAFLEFARRPDPSRVLPL
ncbi:MAG TPA: patatin-like phospholipase family protein [Usitatibacter sp.]|nr:patatin-like phospholipase family protein [Usitatibacter sp.]